MSESSVVSGPGQMSRRTDMASLNPDSPPYGEHAEVQALQSAAGSAQAGGPADPSIPAGGGGFDLSGLVGFGEPGAAGIPVTAGADAGAGPGSSALGLPFGDDRGADANSIDPSLLNILVHQSMQPDSSPSFRRWVRQVLAYRD